MKKLLLYLIIILLPATAKCWGFWAHKKINHVAVFTLPKDMVGFYKSNIDFITEHAVDPDKRRYSDPKEAPKHYIDLDHYGHFPYDTLPHRWRDAVARFTEVSLYAYGTVPWQINLVYMNLVKAFKDKDSSRILRLSADIGHYMADACVPLHTSSNYDGQFTNQKGLHAFWESRIPELYGNDYNYFVGKAALVESPLQLAWSIVLASNTCLDSVFNFEKKITESFSEDQKYSFAQKGKKTVRDYSESFSKAYSDMLDGQVERRLRQAIKAVGSLWYSAWVEAGQPKLKKIVNKSISDEEIKKTNQEEKDYQNGTWKGRSEE
ncbi:MAG: zinc dependent phospholipase C family protein [Bacteroidetes bacterium]|nr:zinc dependent phospholipase C family protein [Bacteroidota bacterium]